jgi:hypothetical protein
MLMFLQSKEGGVSADVGEHQYYLGSLLGVSAARVCTTRRKAITEHSMKVSLVIVIVFMSPNDHALRHRSETKTAENAHIPKFPNSKILSSICP